ncbi:FAD/NAD-P-binding domain-containing protein [Rickenella mellea]|uniref:NADPH:adrenodoxin oxidoreductase, mitochondrial n=1 Tax=Rickenella mellea TaxID=50990 RepID=A0A4Y7PF45_9AGAM|nr:FAD/NAD-P-binding domain-containing protein [Rickenella mellea]
MTVARPIKLAILGGGPSAFYVASRLLQLLPTSHAHGEKLRVHIYDRLWAPHGLVRYGVAPDHPEVKNCTHKFDKAAEDARFRFFGNINVSNTPSAIPHAVNVNLELLYPHYSHILMASGCTMPKLHPAIPPSLICSPALSLVHWYTQHPTLPPPPPLEKLTHVTLIGHGNVSLDIARILLTEPSHLAQYDVPTHVLDKLVQSNIKHVSIVGRRGPLEASFTAKELREMMNLPTAYIVPIDTDLLAKPEGRSRELTRQQTRTLDLFKKGSKNAPGSTRKSWSIDFFRSPTGISPSPSPSSSRAHLSLAHTTLDTQSRSLPTGQTSSLSTDLVITSLGYHASPTDAWYDPALGHIRNVQGRVVDAAGEVMRNVYASGWAASGARGVLASTMMNAYAVADTILMDRFPGEGGRGLALAAGPVVPPTSVGVSNAGARELLNADPDLDLDGMPGEVEDAVKMGRVTQYGDWKRIDEEEVRRGQKLGKERERMGWEEAQKFIFERT